jgi:transposase
VDCDGWEDMMLTVGVDAHKTTIMAVAVDAVGREVARWRGPNTVAGWQAVVTWSTTLDGPCQCGIEGAWNYGRGLAQHLVALGATVYEVNSRLTAEGRRRARRPDKTDGLDARAVARVVQREDALPRVTGEDETSIVSDLVTEREALVVEVTRLRNQLHQVLTHLDPDYRSRLPSLTSQRGVRTAATYTTDDPRPVAQHQVRMVRRLAQRLQLTQEQVRVLTQEIERLAGQHWAPLTEVYGVNLLTAAALAGLLGPGRRFRTDAQLAAFAGVSPLEASSAEQVRHRLNRGGNRRLNAILHRIAITQLRDHPAAQAYIARRLQEGKTKREALRALKRHLARAIWRRWQDCMAAPAPTACSAA